MERIISADMLHYLRSQNVICKHQHGFLSGQSTNTNLLETLNDWTLVIKNKQSVVVAYIDYSKAFVCVSRKKLLIKLSAYGITGNLLQWIDIFLSNRTQQTRVGASLSDMISLASGVVQGSVIGPLLFLLFINNVGDLLCGDRFTSKLYADVKLYTSLCVNDDITHMLNRLNVLYTWSNTWQIYLHLNVPLCKFMRLPSVLICI